MQTDIALPGVPAPKPRKPRASKPKVIPVPRAPIWPTPPAAVPSNELAATDEQLVQMARAGVLYHWENRDAALAEQKKRGKQDQGNRGSATSGRHLDRFRDALGELAAHAGCDQLEFGHHEGLILPGYYRPAKAWDWLLLRRGVLVAACEFKSMVGSVGNNLNNRIEEAVGLAADFWRAYEKGLLMTPEARARYGGKLPPRPFIGYLYLIGDTGKLDEGKRASKKMRFSMDKNYQGTTYVERFGESCTRMIDDKLWTNICFLRSPKGDTGSYSEPLPNLGFNDFARSLYRHIRNWPV